MAVPCIGIWRNGISLPGLRQILFQKGPIYRTWSSHVPLQVFPKEAQCHSHEMAYKTYLLSGIFKGEEQYLPLSPLVFLHGDHQKDSAGHTHISRGLSLGSPSVRASRISVLLEIHWHSLVPLIWTHQAGVSVLYRVQRKPVFLVGDNFGKANVGLFPTQSPRNQRSQQRGLVPAEGDLSPHCSTEKLSFGFVSEFHVCTFFSEI